MLKKLDWYIIKTFFGPFLFIFSVLMFIFVVQFAFSQMDMLTGKGLTVWDVLKLLFYLGIDVVRMVLPLTILLSAIMTFGGFGERYELAAMKSAGISLTRIMAPLFGFVILMSVGLYFFSNRVLPDNQKRARNMMINIANTRPALNFVEGKFIKEVPSFSIKIDRKTGEDGSQWKGIFIHKNAYPFQNQQTIIADKGLLIPSNDKHYLKLELYDGIIYEDNIQGKDLQAQKKQAYTSVKFDTLTQHFDISELIKKSLDQDTGGDNYKYKDFKELGGFIDSLKSDNSKIYKGISQIPYSQLMPNSQKLDSLNYDDYDITDAPFVLKDMDDNERFNIIRNTVNTIEQAKGELQTKNSEIRNTVKYFSRIVVWQQRIVAYSLTCIVFFLIGAPLGSIIRKGGIGMPVVVAIIIFIIFYVLLLYTENLGKNGVLNPYWAAWIPNLALLPLGVFLTIKSMKDSDIFNIDNYIEPIQKYFNKFTKSKKQEHSRYQ